MRSGELLGRRPDPMPRLTWRSILAAYLLIGAGLLSLWAISYPDVAILVGSGVVIGGVSTLLALSIGLRIRRRPICWRRLGLCLSLPGRDRHSERL